MQTVPPPARSRSGFEQMDGLRWVELPRRTQSRRKPKATFACARTRYELSLALTASVQCFLSHPASWWVQAWSRAQWSWAGPLS